MARIGRNEKCPCNSGKKYKHCCARNPRVSQRAATPEEQMKISLLDTVRKTIENAEQKRVVIKELGVFTLFSTAGGNGWLFEVTQADAVQLAKEGVALAVPIDENPETIAIEWSHTFRLVGRKFELCAYQDKTTTILEDCPVKEVAAAIKRIRKKVSKSMLPEIHLNTNG